MSIGVNAVVTFGRICCFIWFHLIPVAALCISVVVFGPQIIYICLFMDRLGRAFHASKQIQITPECNYLCQVHESKVWLIVTLVIFQTQKCENMIKREIILVYFLGYGKIPSMYQSRSRKLVCGPFILGIFSFSTTCVLKYVHITY